MDNRFRDAVTCVPGVRIGVGRNGLSTTIAHGGSSNWRGATGGGGGLQVIGNPRLSGPLPTDRFLIPGTRVDYGTGDVAEMTSSGLESFKALLLATSQRKREVADDLRRARGQVGMAWIVRALGWLTLAAVLPPVRRATSTRLERLRTEVSTLEANLETSVVSVDFDMESEVRIPHQRMREAFEQLKFCERTWSVASSQMIDYVKARTTAGSVVDRQRTWLGHGSDPLVRTSEPPLAMTVQGGRATAYFYPGFVLVAARSGSDFALVDLTDLDVHATVSMFNETETVPGDTVIIGSTWAKANKDGSRDRRFAHNRQLPVTQYGKLTMLGKGGFHQAIMTSKADVCQVFAASVQNLQKVLRTGRSTRKVEGFKALPQNR